MINVQLNTPKKMQFSCEHLSGIGKQTLANAYFASRHLPAQAWNFFQFIFETMVRKTANYFHLKVLTKLLFRNLVTLFILKSLNVLMGSAVAGLGRLNEAISQVLLAATEAFFTFMDDFFLMEEKAELLVVAGDNEIRHSNILNSVSKTRKSRLSLNHVDLLISGFKFNDENPNKKPQQARFKNGYKIPEVIQRYSRPMSCRTLNLFNPMVFKLPLNFNLNAHHTPVGLYLVRWFCQPFITACAGLFTAPVKRPASPL